MDRVLRDQPLAVAVAGLAASAAVAALFPSTEMEGRTLGGARAALTGAAGKAGEMVMDAAGKASRNALSRSAGARPDYEGLQGLANEVAETFTGRLAASRAIVRAPVRLPRAAAESEFRRRPKRLRCGPSFGAGQGKRDTNRSSDMARTNTEPSRGGR